MANKHIDGLRKLIVDKADIERIYEYGTVLLIVWGTTNIKEFRYNDFWQNVFIKIIIASRAIDNCKNIAAPVIYILLESAEKLNDPNFKDLISHCKPIYKEFVENLSNEARKYFN